MIQLKMMWMDHLLCLQNMQKNYKDSMDKDSPCSKYASLLFACLGLSRSGMKTNIHLIIYWKEPVPLLLT